MVLLRRKTEPPIRINTSIQFDASVSAPKADFGGDIDLGSGVDVDANLHAPKADVGGDIDVKGKKSGGSGGFGIKMPKIGGGFGFGGKNNSDGDVDGNLKLGGGIGGDFGGGVDVNPEVSNIFLQKLYLDTQIN